LWLGTRDREYETIDALLAAARSRGFDFMPLPQRVALLLANASPAAPASFRDAYRSILIRPRLPILPHSRTGRTSPNRPAADVTPPLCVACRTGSTSPHACEG